MVLFFKLNYFIKKSKKKKKKKDTDLLQYM